MRFSYEGQDFSIEFERQNREVKYEDGSSHGVRAPSTKPHTTVRLIITPPTIEGVVSAGHIVFRTATVGCWHKDRFSLEKGRIHALRAVGRTLTKGFRTAMWAAYTNRKQMSQVKEEL